MIKLNDLAIGYNGEAILEHIDQEFDDGLIYGILAKSGAGKTTLLKTISGLLHPVHGEVVIDGTTYRNADKNPVYMMHQRYSNFGWLSCTENVLIAQRDKKLRSRDDAIKVLAAVGLEQYADKWPSQLSGGMQQRLTEDRLPLGHGEKSVIILQSFIKLTRDEIVAIRWHMGSFDCAVKGGDYGMGNAFETYPLAVMTHLADMEATYLVEGLATK